MSIETVPVPSPRPAAPSARPAAVGRAAERARLEHLVGGGRHGAAVVVEGAAGLGTSTMLALARDLGRRAGRTVLAGTAGPGGEPLGPFGEAFGPTALLAVLRDAERWSGPGGSPARRQELYSRVRAGLTDLARGRGVLLTVDDVHRADTASAELLAALLRHPPAGEFVLVLGGRAGRLPARVEAAADGAQRLRLAPLGGADHEHLLPTATALRRRLVVAAAGGNPRWVAELASLPVAQLTAVLVDPGRTGDLRGRHDPAVLDDLRTLPADTRRIAGILALLGDEVDVDAAAFVAGTTTDAVAAEVDRLRDHDVLHDVEGRIRFLHPLVRAAAARLVPCGGRAGVHRRAERWLGEQGADPLLRAPHVAAVARWGDPVAADLLVDAARDLAGDDPATAARWLDIALRLGSRDTDRDAVRLDGARAWVRAGEPDRAERAAADVLTRPGPDRLPAALLLARLRVARGEWREATLLLKAEREAAAAPQRALLDVELGAVEVHQGRVAPMLQAAGGPGGCTPAVLAGAAVVRGASALLTGAAGAAARLVADAARAVDGLDTSTLGTVLHVLPLLVAAEHHLGGSAAATRHAERGLVGARCAGRPEDLPALRLAAAVVALDADRPAVAARWAEDAQDAALDLGWPGWVAAATTVRALATAWTDGPGAALTLLDGADPGETPGGYAVTGAWWQPAAAGAHAEVLLLAGRPGAARAVCRAALSTGAGDTAVDARLWTLAARAALDEGDAEGAQVLLDRARRAAAGASGATRAAVDLVQSAGALAAGDTTRAVTLARAAVGATADRPLTVPAARAAAALAVVRAAAGDPDAAGDAAGAADRLDRLGAGWLARQVRDELQHRRTLLPGPVDGLSRREREIALLVREGLTNRAIAERLVLSVRTVDSHVARILAKLGVPSRMGVVHALQAAPLARRDG